MVNVMIEKFKEKISEELKYFNAHPNEVYVENIERAVTRCYGALVLATDTLYALGYNELATELGQHWDEIDRTAFYDILYKSWMC